jgi:predicted short-subunit dehydrogenase-like oxidoreductase (DUF2520 family)
LRTRKVAIGRLHPLAAIASSRYAPSLEGLTAHISGDARAQRVAARLARAAGLTPNHAEVHDTSLYHAAAVMVAGGGVALLDAASRLLQDAGIDPADGAPMLASLLRSVSDNVAKLGTPAALTGPVRRGDVRTVAAHAAKLGAASDDRRLLYRALVRAQIPLGRELDEAASETFDEIAEIIEKL